MFETLISEEFAKGLGLKIDEKDATQVGTAHKDGKMKILGVTEKFIIYFEGIKTGFNIQAYVAENLNQPLNLGRRFIGEVQAKLEFEKTSDMAVKSHTTHTRKGKRANKGKKREAERKIKRVKTVLNAEGTDVEKIPYEIPRSKYNSKKIPELERKR